MWKKKQKRKKKREKKTHAAYTEINLEYQFFGIKGEKKRCCLLKKKKKKRKRAITNGNLALW